MHQADFKGVLISMSSIEMENWKNFLRLSFSFLLYFFGPETQNLRGPILTVRFHKVTAGGRPVGMESRIDRYLRQRLGQIERGITVKTFEGEDAEFEFDSLANREPVYSVPDIFGNRIEFSFSHDKASCGPKN